MVTVQEIRNRAVSQAGRLKPPRKPGRLPLIGWSLQGGLVGWSLPGALVGWNFPGGLVG